MKKVIINLKPRYPIYIGQNLLQSSYLVAACKKQANRVVIIADQNVSALYGKQILNLLQKNNLKAHLLAFKTSEKNKTRRIKEKLEDAMFKLGYGRDTCIIAVGGGITTDLVGFIASTYCRGIPAIYIPTSLLAMIDASIGGKTGVNTEYGKNLIGTFYQPKAVFIDMTTLKTLPNKEFKNGMAELIKHAVIKEKTLFNFLAKNVARIEKLDYTLLTKAISTSCKIKKVIIEHDEKESGMRQLCNFGHTIGHAIEIVSNHRINHGGAVALGIIAESFMAMRLGFLSPKDFKEIENIFKLYNIPTKLTHNYPLKSLITAMRLDKKSMKNIPYFVLPNKIGKHHFAKTGYSIPVPKKIIVEGLNYVSCNH